MACALSRASAAVVADLQARSPQRVATIDVDATILASSKRAARPCYDGRRGYQPVVALWAEQDAIVADEFRDGNVSAQSGNRRVIEGALAALPEGVDRVFLRVDSALYDHFLMVYLDQRQVGFAISVPVSPGLMRRMQDLDEAAWHLEREDESALRHWAVLNTLARLTCHARERVLRLASGFARSVLDRFRVCIHARRRSWPETEPLRRPSPRPGRPGSRTVTPVPTTPSARQCRRHTLSETAGTSDRRRPNLKSRKSTTKCHPSMTTSDLLGE